MTVEGNFELITIVIVMTASAAGLYYAIKHAIGKVIDNQIDIKEQFSSLKSSHYTLRDDLKTEVGNLRVSSTEDRLRHEKLIDEVKSLTHEMRTLTSTLTTLIQQNATNEELLRNLVREHTK